ncbi:hypothetical protein QAD02_003806, partial [Eretmocerus hayati]
HEDWRKADMRRQSLSSSLSSGSSSGGAPEPLIVVEESTLAEEEEADRLRDDSPQRCLEPDSPSLNPYLLSPWRETRKHSLPTPQCTSGITASQVRRLSERGGEGSGPSAREAAFLATLSQSQPPQPGGRRHSVVTISRVPATLFGRNRRESIAAFPMGGAPRILGSRRDSATGLPSGPPSNSGSTHNLALDIMDDIAEIKAARKVRLKMWKTPSHERVCEVQPLEGNGGAAQRYTRRYSDFALATIPANSALPGTSGSNQRQQQRRASEMPSTSRMGPPPPIPPRSGAGIVCTNTDLLSILSSLTSSATEIDRCGTDDDTKPANPATSVKSIEHKRNRLKSSRSNSFDVSILHGCHATTDTGVSKQSSSSSSGGRSVTSGTAPISGSTWFAKRHQPMAKKQRSIDAGPGGISGGLGFKLDRSRVIRAVKDTLAKTSPTKDEEAAVTAAANSLRNRVVWDGSSGTKVDAQVLGNAIEEFLRKSGNSSSSVGEISETSDAFSSSTTSTKHHPATSPSGRPPRSGSKASSWFASSGPVATPASPTTPTPSPAAPSSGKQDDEQTEACEPSICSSLKDLFVK